MRRLLLPSSLVLAACNGPAEPLERCSGPPPVAETDPVFDLDVRFVAGDGPLVLDADVEIQGLVVRLEKARIYLSELALLDAGGDVVPTALVDASGVPLPYDLVLVDLAHPDTHRLHVKAPAGSYDGLRATVGVPDACASGETLNHADASVMQPPLDVDSDMYWSWNAGYVFVKLEGRIVGDDAFFFHLGGGARLTTVDIPGRLVVHDDGDAGRMLLVDLERLLTDAAGRPAPDLGDAEARRVHGGAHADQLARNAAEPGFLRLTGEE